MKERTQVVIVASHPIQHFCPFYRALAADGRLALHVLFGSAAGLTPYFDPGFGREVQWNRALLGGFSHEFLPGAQQLLTVGRPVSNAALEARLEELNPHVVQVYGFWHGISRAAIRWARRRRRRVLLMADSELRTRRGLLQRVRKRILVPWLLSRVDAFLTIGDNNERYYQHYGANPQAFFRCPYPIDEPSLQAAAGRRDENRSKLRGMFGLPPSATIALFVGKLIPRKAPNHVVLALARLRAEARSNPTCIFAGDGELRAALTGLARSGGVDSAHVAGFVDPSALPTYYVGSDYLVHPAIADPHPLATSEAVYCGLPVIVSDRVGSVGPTDDVRPGQNAIQYPFGDIAALAAAMDNLTVGLGLRAEMSARSHQIGRERGLASSVRGFVEAALTAVGPDASPVLPAPQ